MLCLWSGNREKHVGVQHIFFFSFSSGSHPIYGVTHMQVCYLSSIKPSLTYTYIHTQTFPWWFWTQTNWQWKLTITQTLTEKDIKPFIMIHNTISWWSPNLKTCYLSQWKIFFYHSWKWFTWMLSLSPCLLFTAVDILNQDGVLKWKNVYRDISV